MKYISTAELHRINSVSRSRQWNQWVEERYFKDLDPCGPHVALFHIPHGLRPSPFLAPSARPVVTRAEDNSLVLKPTHFRVLWYDMRSDHAAAIDTPREIWQELPDLPGLVMVVEPPAQEFLNCPVQFVEVNGNHFQLDGFSIYEVARKYGREAQVLGPEKTVPVTVIGDVLLQEVRAAALNLPLPEPYEQPQVKQERLRQQRLSKRRAARLELGTPLQEAPETERCSLCQRSPEKLWVDTDGSVFCYRCRRPPTIELPEFVPAATELPEAVEAEEAQEARPAGHLRELGTPYRSGNKRVVQFLEQMKQYGIVASHTPGGHICLRRVDGVGGMVFTASTPGSHRWEHNLLRDLRRLGLVPRP